MIDSTASLLDDVALDVLVADGRDALIDWASRLLHRGGGWSEIGGPWFDAVACRVAMLAGTSRDAEVDRAFRLAHALLLARAEP